MTGEELQELNPQILRGTTPPGDPLAIRIPAGRSGLLAANLENARAEAPAVVRVAEAAASHKVTRGESLSTIAKRHGVSVAAIQRANEMGRRTVIRTGQVLRIPA